MSDTGGPAFPYSALSPEGPAVYADSKGMTLRDYFAGQALIGLLSQQKSPLLPDLDAEAAYAWADAMLKERRQP